MTTPRIDEMVKKETDEILSLVQPGIPFKTRHPQRDKIERRLERALTQAHQAGIDEAVEAIKEWVQENKDLTTIFGSNQAHWYIEAEALDDTIKALQNNK